MNETIYPVRGVLQGFREGSFTFDEAEDCINDFISKAMEKGYSHGVVDGLRRNGETHAQASYKGSTSV